jgi:predicted kinase
MLEQLGAIRLRADVERKRLFATALNQPEALYSDEANQKTYDRLFELADYLHSIGLHVIVDATFVDQARIDQFTTYFSHLARQTCQIVLCQAPIEAMRSRIITRQSQAQDPSDATPAILDQQVARQSKNAMQWLFTLHRLDNDGSIADLELKTDRLVTSILTNN